MGFAGVAQSVEQLICNQQVAGSSPITSSSLIIYMLEGFPSGQREQTVNLPAEPTEVRILPPPPGIFEVEIGGSSSVARASAFQAEGRGFESRFPLQVFIKKGQKVNILKDYAHVAQLVEHILGKDEVTSSILVVGSS